MGGNGISKLIGIAAFLGIAWLSLASDPLPSQKIRMFLRPYDHLLMYTVFTGISLWVWKSRTALVLAVVFSIGIIMETVQIFLPTRSFSIEDLATNLLGVALGAILFHALRYLLSAKET